MSRDKILRAAIPWEVSDQTRWADDPVTTDPKGEASGSGLGQHADSCHNQRDYAPACYGPRQDDDIVYAT